MCIWLSGRSYSPDLMDLVYLAGIRLLHVEHGYEDPTKDAPLLSYLCTGIRCSERKSSKSRLPLTISHLHAIMRQLSISCFSSLLYWAAFTLAFYGFLKPVSTPVQHRPSTSDPTTSVWKMLRSPSTPSPSTSSAQKLTASESLALF